ncbi:MAG: PAS domain S-box protein, partial [Anaerolineae bacterium]
MPATPATALSAMRASGHWQYRLKDGRVIVCDIHAHNLTFAGREASLVVAQDITERLQAEAKLHESEEITRALINASSDVVALVDAQGTILTLNESMARRIGQNLADLVGQNIFELLPSDIAQARKKFFDQVRQTGQPVHFEDENQGIFFDHDIYPVINPTGEMTRFAVYAHDTTARRRMQEALRATEASFRLLFDNNPHPMWVYDRQTLAFLEVNEAAIDHYGYSRDEFLRMNALDLRTPEEGARLLEYMRRSHPDLRRAGHWQHRLKDGRFIEVEINSHVINFAGREAVLVVAQDITARLQAEAKLRESEERFRQLAENITEVFWIFDPLSPVVYVSPAYETVWGRTCQSLYEQPFTFIEAAHPEDRLRLNEAISQQFDGQPTEIEYRIVRPDGSIRWVWERGFPIFDETRQVVRVVGVATDITERKQTEEKLRASEERFRQLADNIDQVFWMFDVSDLVYISPAYETIWGRTCQSLYENSFSFMESIHPDDQARLNQAIEQQLQGQRTETEYRVVRPDGSMRWVVDRGFPIFDEQGQVYRIAGIAVDITARRQAELDLWQRTQEYETLVENVPDIIQRFDRSLRTIYVNSAFTKIFGIPV